MSHSVSIVCSICVEAVVFGQQHQRAVSALLCGHVFHRSCLRRWVRQNQNDPEARVCPDCRHPCDATQLIRIISRVGPPTADVLEEARKTRELQAAAAEAQSILRDVRVAKAAQAVALRQQRAAKRSDDAAQIEAMMTVMQNREMLTRLKSSSGGRHWDLEEQIRRLAALPTFNEMKGDLKRIFDEFFEANLPAASDASTAAADASAAAADASTAAATRVSRPNLRPRPATSDPNPRAPKRGRSHMN